MPIWYAAFCPAGDECSKKGKRLCCCKTVEEAKAKVSWHLQTSSYHDMQKDLADSLAEDAPLEEVEYDDEPPKDKKDIPRGGMKGGKGSKNKGKQPQQQQHGQDWCRADWHSGEWSTSSSSNRPGPYDVAVAPVQPHAAIGRGEVLEVLASIGRAEAASRTAARMARSAALAFEEENSIMTAAMAKIQKLIQHDGQ